MNCTQIVDLSDKEKAALALTMRQTKVLRKDMKLDRGSLDRIRHQYDHC